MKLISVAAGLEASAVDAIPYVEPITDDGEQHGVRAVKQLAIFDGLKGELEKNVGSAAAVPADSMSRFRLQPDRRRHRTRVYDPRSGA
jgi:hypothetical protein